MKNIFLKTAIVGLIAMGTASCADELNIQSIDPKTSPSFDDMELLAKQYATLGLTGQIGGAGNSDISGDEGEIGFIRTTFNLEELCTDICAWAWQDNEDIKPLTNIQWTSSSSRAYWAYQRLAYDITLYNSYLSQQGGRSDGEYPHYLAEVRFLRALHYWYFLDLFHKAPFKTDFSMSELPIEKGGKDLYDWIDQELTEIEPLLASIGSFNNTQNFGRADQGAAYALHARLALNSEVYTDGQVKDYQKAIDYCDKVIAGPYALSVASKNGFTGYEQVFMGDNDTNPQAMKEIIFAIRQDGNKTQSHAGSTYMVSSCRVAGMPYSYTDNYWSCNFARKSLIEKFFPNVTDCKIPSEDAVKKYMEDHNLKNFENEADVIAADAELGGSTADIIKAANDDRAMFYGGVGGDSKENIRKYTMEKNIKNFYDGLSIVKWQNRRSDNSSPSPTIFSDTDIPVFRLAEMYMTRAEAKLRLGKAGAVDDVNVIRARAHTNTLNAIELKDMPDEWCREFYFEGRRRSDLVRFGLFTSSRYVWPMKGGTPTGTGVDSHYNIYPIPDNDLAGNPNMTQNPGY
jgi:hypothetical protein